MIRQIDLKIRILGVVFCGALSTSLSQAAIDDGLVAHYDFDGAGLGDDATGNGHTLDNIGASSSAGIKGNGAFFDGFGWMETSAADDFDTAGDFTWAVWFRVDDEGPTGGILSKSGDGWAPGAKALFKGEESFLGFDVGWVGAAEYEGEILDGEWHHAVVVARFPEGEDLGLVELYVDGERVGDAEGGAAEFAEPEGSIFRVGSGSPGDDFADEFVDPFPEVPTFSGAIDEVRVYNRALDFEDIKAVLIDGIGGLDAPEIVAQPADAQGIAGRSVSLSVDVVGLFVSYQWFKGDQPIEGAVGPVLSLNDLTADDAGQYKVTASNDSGSVESGVATVTVLDEWTPGTNLLAHWNFDTAGQPGADAGGNGHDLDDVFTTQGAGIKGQALDLDRLGRLEDTDGSMPFETLKDFTWTAFIKTSEENGTIVAKSPGDDDFDNPNTWSPGSKALFVRDGELGFDTGWIGDVGSPVALNDGEWHHVGISVDIRDGADAVQLWVDGNPSGLWDSADLEEQPDPGIFFIGYGSDDFPFDGDENWFMGQIDEVRVYSQALIQDDIVQLLINDGGTLQPPAITQQPIDATVVEGRTARFRVGASGTGVTYQWRKGDQDIPDATAATLTIPGVAKSDAGEYSVVVSSAFADPPVSVASDSATLTVEDAPVFAGGELAHLGPFLESYWSFDEVDSNGLVPDLSPLGNHHGELLNDAALTSGGQGFGGSGEALNAFDGDNAHMAAAEAESYDFNSDYTWTARVKLSEPALEGEEVGSGIFGRSPADTDHNHGSKIIFITGQSIGFDTGWVGLVNSADELALDAWHQVTMTYSKDDDVIGIWLDDQPVSTEEGDEVFEFDFNVDEFPEDEEFNGGFANTGFRVGGGANGFYNDPFPGLIDDAAVWSVVLSPEEIALLANGVSPLPEVGEPPTAPTVGLSREGESISITFTGKLQAADDPTGGWSDVAGASSPYAVDTSTADRKFFRSVE